MLSTVAVLSMITGAFLSGCDKGYETLGGIEYAAPEGKALDATLYLPAGETSQARRPAMVLIHGGAWMAGSRRQLYWYGRRLAEHGYVTLSISYRIMPRGHFPAPVEDAKAAVRWLRKNAGKYRIDPDRIGALGTSAGGHLALMLAVTTPDDGLEGTQNPGYSSAVAAAVSLYGPTDLKVFEEPGKHFIPPSNRFWRHYVSSFVGEKSLNGRTPLQAASPISYVTKDSAPILCIHGDEDPLVPVDQTKSFCKKLEELGVPHQYVEMKGYTHAFDYVHPKVRKRLFNETILPFLDEHLKP